MARKRTGGWTERGGAYYIRLRLGVGAARCERRAEHVTSDEQAERWATCAAELVAVVLAAGRASMAVGIVEGVAKATCLEDLASMRRVVRQTIASGVPAIVARAGEGKVTYQAWSEEWTGGALHERYPDHVVTKNAADDIYWSERWIYPHVGPIPVQAFRLEHAELVMSKLPGPSLMTSTTRRHVAQIMHRTLQLAVYPGRLIAVNPIPRGFLPKKRKGLALQMLYPDEDRALLACTDIPMHFRLLYGMLAREGLRSVSEAAALEWPRLALDRGSIDLDKNKTNMPRMWALSDGVVRALEKWKECLPSGQPLVFPFDTDHLAQKFRDHLALAGITRPELFKSTAERRQIRVHDLRASFVTVSLAAGKSETWVMDRTGHRSSAQLQAYQRAARAWAEMNLGEFGPLADLIPEWQPGWIESKATVRTGRPTRVAMLKVGGRDAERADRDGDAGPGERVRRGNLPADESDHRDLPQAQDADAGGLPAIAASLMRDGADREGERLPAVTAAGESSRRSAAGHAGERTRGADVGDPAHHEDEQADRGPTDEHAMISAAQWVKDPGSVGEGDDVAHLFAAPSESTIARVSSSGAKEGNRTPTSFTSPEPESGHSATGRAKRHVFSVVRDASTRTGPAFTHSSPIERVKRGGLRGTLRRAVRTALAGDEAGTHDAMRLALRQMGLGGPS